MNHLFKLLLMMCLLALIQCKEADKTINVSGYLTNGSKSVSGAKIDLDGLVQYEVSTDAAGHFEIQNVSPGTHDLNIQKKLTNNSFSRTTKTIQVSQSLQLNSLVLPEPVQLVDPSIVQGFTEDEITLKWTKYTGDDYREYKIYRLPTQGLDETTGELIYVTTNSSDTSFVTKLPHSSQMYYRVFVLNETSLLAGSNLGGAITTAFINDPLIEIGTEKACFLNAGETVWLSFKAQKGEIYKIAWFDSFLNIDRPHIGNYSANSVYISAYRADKVTQYFPDLRLLQMEVSPMPVVAEETEDIYLKFYGYDNSTVGTFGVRVDKLDKASAQKVDVGGASVAVPVNLGEMKLLYFDGELGQSYNVSSIATVKSGCCGDGISMHISAYRENINSPYFYRAFVALANGNQPSVNALSPPANEKVYLVLDGSYWFDPNSAVISVAKQ